MGGAGAIVSYHRLTQEFYGLPHDLDLLANRLLIESVHELGHTLRLTHCEDSEDTIPDSYLTSITNLKNNTKYVQSIYRSGVVVSISSLDIVNINSKVDLKANIVPAGGQVSSINWSITSKPEGSNAAIANPSALNTSFTPDLKGDYNIKLSLTINGIEVYDIKLIKAINDQKPIAILKIDNPEISSSDSVLLRFDASYDPDGDSLSFALNGQEFLVLILPLNQLIFIQIPDLLVMEKLNCLLPIYIIAIPLR